jgi:alpha-beta hydrolase superfamily lysophospholipase
MRAAIRTVKASDGYLLHLRHYAASGQRRGVVVGLHGIQSHSGWYERSSIAMADCGFEVYFADRRGSGLNQQFRGHADHGMRLVHDVRQVIRFARTQHPHHTPLVLLSVSWGGKIAAATATSASAKIDGLALLYPGLEPKIRPTHFQLQQLRLARHFDIRHRPVPLPLSDPALFTDNRDARQFIANDGLAIHTVTSGFLNAGLDLDRRIQQQGILIRQPVLLMLAGQDRIIDNDRTRQCVARFGSTNLTTIEFPKARHTLEFEAEQTNFIPLLTNWLQDCAAGKLCVRDVG